jgi:hypothetical protein
MTESGILLFVAEFKPSGTHSASFPMDARGGVSSQGMKLTITPTSAEVKNVCVCGVWEDFTTLPMSNLCSVEWQYLEKNPSWPNSGAIAVFACRVRKKHETIRIAGDLEDIRTQHLSNTNLERHRYANTLCKNVWSYTSTPSCDYQYQISFTCIDCYDLCIIC